MSRVNQLLNKIRKEKTVWIMETIST
jgi:hypothetical protein